MWTRLRLAAARRARELLLAAGTARVSLPLALLGGAALAADALWRRDEGAHPLAGTWPWWTVVVAMAADALVAVLRDLPVRQRPDGALERVAFEPRRTAALLLRGAWLLAALGLVASTAARDRFLFRVAEGERFAASPEQLVRRDPLRSMARSPFAVELDVLRVRGAPGERGALRADLAHADGGAEVVTATSPAWFGWGRYLRAVEAGVAVRYEVAGTAGGRLDGAFAKLDARRGGQAPLVRPEGVPLRLVVAVPEGAALAAGAPPALRVAAYRGKLLAAEGDVRDGKPLAVDDLSVSFPEWRPWVELEMVSDPGLPLGVLGALLAAAAGAVALGARLLPRRDARTPPAGGGEGR
jgi:hypothetical protein